MNLDECRHQVEGWLSIKLTTGRCSALLVDELSHHMLARTLDVFCIYDEIGVLEGAPMTRSRLTKPASMFTHPILRGLWHKHYTTPAFIGRNLTNHWTQLRLKALIADVEADDDVVADLKGNLFIYRLIMDGHRERHEAERMTGEWIIFAKCKGGNAYLTLANHNEADEEIRDRVDRAAAEFADIEL
jgi:hypothetical protein